MAGLGIPSQAVMPPKFARAATPILKNKKVPIDRHFLVGWGTRIRT
jgi:hypothetical protein